MNIQKKISILFGSSGYLGSELGSAFQPDEIITTHCSHKSLNSIYFDVQKSKVRNLIIDLPILPTTAIILLGNTNIDECYINSKQTYAINVNGIIQLINDLIFFKIKPIFISSDGVFNGDKSFWKEVDVVSPILEYGKQKSIVEEFIKSINFPWIIVRAPKLLSLQNSERCIINEWLKKLSKGENILCATNQFFSPAAIEDVANAIVLLNKSEAEGIFHLGGTKRISRRDLLELVIIEFKKYVDIKPKIIECSLDELPVHERRPYDTSLNSQKFKKIFNYEFKSPEEIVKSSVSIYLNEFIKSNKYEIL